MIRRLLCGLLAAAFFAAQANAARLIRDAEIERTMERIAEPIFAAAGLGASDVEILLLQDRSLNAFVFGERKMVFNSGLLMRLETPSALAGVLAHETGHIAGGHLTRRRLNIDRMSGPIAVATILAVAAAAASGSSEVGAAAALGSQSAIRRSLLAYSRSEEASADQAGVSYMTEAGYDPEGMLAVLRLLRGQEVFAAGQTDPYALTHPLSSERIRLLEDRIARAPTAGVQPPGDIGYWHDRMRAKLSAFIDDPGRVLASLETAADPESELSRLKRAVALHRLPDPDAALAEADRLLALRPQDPFYWELKGQILYESGRGEAAVAPYRRAVELAPDEPLIRGGLGRALLALDDPARDAEALAALEQATRDDPGEPGVLRDLAIAYARGGEEGRAALATAERFALLGQPQDAYRMAGRALDLLPRGAPGWLKADDIRSVAERELRAQ